MTATTPARAAVSRAKHSHLLERLTRAGFLGWGLVHALVAWLAVQIAYGKPAPAGDQSGALRTLAGQPLGRFLVIVVAVGLAAMALWQALEAAVGHRAERGRERAFERVASVGRAVVYGYFAWTAVQVVNAGPSSAQRQQAATAKLMAEPGGRWLVGLIGVAVAALGVGLAVYGIVRRFEKNLNTAQMSETTRSAAGSLGTVGYVAKGAAYGIVGVLLVAASANYDPGKTRGLDAALHTLAGEPYGKFLLVAIAVGLAAFALFCVVQARYRKV